MHKFILPSLFLLSLTLGAQEQTTIAQVTPPAPVPTPATIPQPTPVAPRPVTPPPARQVNRTDALALLNAGQYELALAQTEREIRANPNNMDARAIRTWALVAVGRYSDTQKLAEESLKITPRDVRFIEILGEAFFYQNNLDKALIQFGQYAELAPRGARIGRVYSFMGDAYTAKGMTMEAEFAYTSATLTLPNSVALWMKIGESRLRLKNDITARRAFERVLVLSPGNVQALAYLKNL